MSSPTRPPDESSALSPHNPQPARSATTASPKYDHQSPAPSPQSQPEHHQCSSATTASSAHPTTPQPDAPQQSCAPSYASCRTTRPHPDTSPPAHRQQQFPYASSLTSIELSPDRHGVWFAPTPSPSGDTPWWIKPSTRGLSLATNGDSHMARDTSDRKRCDRSTDLGSLASIAMAQSPSCLVEVMRGRERASTVDDAC